MATQESDTRTIFYSWQSDLPNSSNRGLISSALEKACRGLSKDDEIPDNLVIDQAVRGKTGSPDISRTIFEKIVAADAFVADVTNVGHIIHKRWKLWRRGRASPNPNVLLELGFAYHVLGEERVILVRNEAHQGDLPFDLRNKRYLAYENRPNEKQRSHARKSLTQQLTSQLKPILSGPAASMSKVVVSVELRIGVPTYGFSQGNDFGRDNEVFYVKVFNHCKRAVYIDGVSFLRNDGHKLWPSQDAMGTHQQKQEIAAGDSLTRIFSATELAQAGDLQLLESALATDTLGHEYLSPEGQMAEAVRELKGIRN